MKNPFGFLLVVAGLLSGTAVVAQEQAVRTDGCTGFRFNLDRELELFAGAPSKLVARETASTAPEAALARLYSVQLLPQSQIKFVVAPDHPTVADGSYAGVLRVRSAQSGKLRVTLDEAAWIDVVAGDMPIISSDHNGSAACKLLRKSVEFPVTAGKELLLQISGSTVAAIKLAMTQHP